jgi:hypothetical protein
MSGGCMGLRLGFVASGTGLGPDKTLARCRIGAAPGQEDPDVETPYQTSLPLN